MDADEQLARKLQAEFDEEISRVEAQERMDNLISQRLAASSHDLSDSEGEDDAKTFSPKKAPSPMKKDISNTSAKGAAMMKDTGMSSLPVCSYGARCYRKNPQHFKEFSHPTKDDSRTTEPPQKKLKREPSRDDSPSAKPANVSSKESSLSRKSEKDVGSSSREKLSKQSDNGSLKRSSSSGRASGSPSPKKIVGETSKDDSGRKKNLKNAEQLPFIKRLEASHPYRFFLNRSFSVKETHSDILGLVLPDLLNPTHGNLIESAQLSFMVDLEFLITFYRVMKLDEKPLLIMYGELDGQPKNFPTVTCKKVNMPYQYGVHHSKLMFLKYKEGLRIVVHTANLVPDDWQEKAQGFWVSPIFPPLDNGKVSILEGESPTSFKKDVIDYLIAYKCTQLMRWTHIVKGHDLSSCNAIFVGCIPGYHVGEAKYKYGHTKVRSLLKKHSTWQPSIARPVIAQCSSIGSLGKDARSWLTSEFGVSLSGGVDAGNSTVQLVYPTEEDVRTSCQGYSGGSCLPYNSNTHLKQNWLQNHMFKWRSKIRKRDLAMPHIKSYTRISKDQKSVQYFILTSANLSKAAWGMLQKQNSQLFIRSYEAGVILLPKYVNGSDSFELSGEPELGSFSLHYDLPLTPFRKDDIPWFKDTKKNKKDVLGEAYLW